MQGLGLMYSRSPLRFAPAGLWDSADLLADARGAASIGVLRRRAARDFGFLGAFRGFRRAFGGVLGLCFRGFRVLGC